MTARALAALFLSVAAAAVAHAASPIDPGRLSADVKALSSDAFEGRGPATRAEPKTIAWIIERMKAAGLQPGGTPGGPYAGWTQDVPLARFELKGPVKLSMTYGGQAHALTQTQEIVVQALVPVDRVAIKAAPLVFVGYGVKAPERGWDDFKGYDLKGKIAVVLINDPDFETPQPGKFDGKAMTYYGRWTYKYEEAARQGALGMLIVHETAPAAYGWNTVKNSNGNAQFDVVREDPRKGHPELQGWIQRDLAVELFKASGLDFEAQKKRAQTEGFTPVELRGASFSADFAVDHSQIVSHNVLGKLPGTKHPDQVVLYTAHWDHLGVGQPDAKGDAIYNGAVDNADGVASILELGRAFAHAPRTQRTVVFMAVTAEEKGLLGSEYYASHPVYPLPKTVADINIDALATTGPAKDISTSGNSALELQDELAAAAVKDGRRFTPDAEPQAGHYFRSDHFTLAKRGVPAISIESGQDLVNGGVAAGKAWKDDYVKTRYHQPADEWSASMDFTGMAQDLDLVQRLGTDLANSTRWPAWKPGSEFKAVRDASASERG